jgi:hypothetical protein
MTSPRSWFFPCLCDSVVKRVLVAQMSYNARHDCQRFAGDAGVSGVQAGAGVPTEPRESEVYPVSPRLCGQGQYPHHADRRGDDRSFVSRTLRHRTLPRQVTHRAVPQTASRRLCKICREVLSLTCPGSHPAPTQDAAPFPFFVRSAVPGTTQRVTFETQNGYQRGRRRQGCLGHRPQLPIFTGVYASNTICRTYKKAEVFAATELHATSSAADESNSYNPGRSRR